MKLDGGYRQSYETVFRELLDSTAPDRYDESALPSYTHGNALIKWLFWNRIETALAMAGDVRGRKVLDFGCGGGITFRYLQENGAYITGCDTETALARTICEKFGIQADLRGDLFSMDGKFDIILALDVLEHLDDLDRFLEKFEALSHGGTRLVVSGPTENFLYKLGRIAAGFSDKGHYHVRNIYDIEESLRAKGFSLERVKKLYFPVVLFRASLWSLKSPPS